MNLSAFMWVVEDVIGQAKEIGKKINKKEAQQVLEDVERKFNSEFGISWETINRGIEELINNKNKKIISGPLKSILFSL